MRWLEPAQALVLAQELLELPELMVQARRKLTGLRGEQRQVAARLARRENELAVLVLESEDYQAARSKEIRDILMSEERHGDEAWSALSERTIQVAVAVDKARDALTVLEESRKAIKGVLEREAAELVKEAIEDGTLARAVTGNRGVRA